MADWTDEQKRTAWQNALRVDGHNPAEIKRDVNNAIIKWAEHGEAGDDEFRWEIDHAFPEAKGGKKDNINIRAMHWKNNNIKDDNYPIYNSPITRDGTSLNNKEHNGRWVLRPEHRKQLKKLYEIPDQYDDLSDIQ